MTGLVDWFAVLLHINEVLLWFSCQHTIQPLIQAHITLIQQVMMFVHVHKTQTSRIVRNAMLGNHLLVEGVSLNTRPSAFHFNHMAGYIQATTSGQVDHDAGSMLEK